MATVAAKAVISEDTYRREFGERMHAARIGAGLTQAELAVVLGKSGSTVSNLESGRQACSAYLAALVADITCCDAGWLLTGRVSAWVPGQAPPTRAMSADQERHLRELSDTLGKAAGLLKMVRTESVVAADPPQRGSTAALRRLKG